MLVQCVIGGDAFCYAETHPPVGDLRLGIRFDDLSLDLPIDNRFAANFDRQPG
jgi:hypothetical protein